jgi:TIR domain
MQHKVFISASYQDRDIARDLQHRLHKVGVSVTYSELTMSIGSDFEKTFMSLLRAADEIIVILSRNSIDNLWMMYEIGAASSLQKTITPVVIELENSELPPVVKQLKYIRYDKLSKYISNIGQSEQRNLNEALAH